MVDEQAVRERSEVLQHQVLALLRDPAACWEQQPAIAAHALAELLGVALGAVVTLHRERLPFALWLLDQVRQRVLAVAAAEDVKH